jgi:hypothetical protein
MRLQQSTAALAAARNTSYAVLNQLTGCAASKLLAAEAQHAVCAKTSPHIQLLGYIRLQRTCSGHPLGPCYWAARDLPSFFVRTGTMPVTEAARTNIKQRLHSACVYSYAA